MQLYYTMSSRIMLAYLILFNTPRIRDYVYNNYAADLDLVLAFMMII